MNISKRLIFPVFLAIAISSTGLECMAQDSTQPSIYQLKEQMKTFQGRLRIYYKCLRKKCSDKERAIVKKAVIKDGLITVLLLGTFALAFTLPSMQYKYLLHQRAEFKKKHAKMKSPSDFFKAIGITQWLKKNSLLTPEHFKFTEETNDQVSAELTLSELPDKETVQKWRRLMLDLSSFLGNKRFTYGVDILMRGNDDHDTDPPYTLTITIISNIEKIS